MLPSVGLLEAAMLPVHQKYKKMIMMIIIKRLRAQSVLNVLQVTSLRNHSSVII